MATLMSALFGCDTVDKKATEPIITQLSAKYGKSFTVYALGDRIGKNTATAYVYADDDPTMLFIARVTDNGVLEFENYAYRCVCRKVEDAVKVAFEEYGISSECFADFSSFNNDINPDTSVDSYIKDTSPESVVVTIIVKASGNITGENLEQIYSDIYSRLPDIIFGTGLYILTAEDFDKVADSVRLGTQVFDAYRLKVSGAEDDIRRLRIGATNDGLSFSAEEVDAELLREVD
jgi:hypothetical protein